MSEMASTSPPAVPAPSSRRRWAVHLSLIAAYLLFIGIIGWTRAGSRAPRFVNRASSLVVVSALELLTFGVVFGAAWAASRATRDDLLLRWRGSLWPVPLGVAYSVALRLSLVVAVLVPAGILVVSGLVTPDDVQHFFRTHAPNIGALVDLPAMSYGTAYFWVMLTLVSFVVAGLREELWRSAFLAGLGHVWPAVFGSRAGQVRAVAIAAVVFGLGHAAMGPIAVVLAGVIGFGLGLIMVLHRSIWPAVIAHGTFDATTMALLPWVMTQMKHYPQVLGQ